MNKFKFAAMYSIRQVYLACAVIVLRYNSVFSFPLFGWRYSLSGSAASNGLDQPDQPSLPHYPADKDQTVYSWLVTPLPALYHSQSLSSADILILFFCSLFSCLGRCFLHFLACSGQY